MIGAGTTIRGKLSGEEDLVVKGNIEGAVQLDSNLSVEASARLAASVDAHAVDISGEIAGDIQASVSVTVAAGATVIGDVTTPKISVAEGATFRGRIDMDFEV